MVRMRIFLILTFSLLAIGFIGIFYYVQHTTPKNIAEQNAKQSTSLSLPYKNNNSNDALATPQPNTNNTFNSSPDTVSPTTMQQLVSATTATIKTTKGEITMTLFPDVAPKTVSNFATKAMSGYYNGLTFHRVEDWVLQGGDPKGDGTGGGDMPTEFNDKPFSPGAVGVARKGDPKVQNDSQFFIVKTDATWLNGQYTNFGMVTSGMDVVNKMEIGDKILSITVE